MICRCENDVEMCRWGNVEISSMKHACWLLAPMVAESPRCHCDPAFRGRSNLRGLERTAGMECNQSLKVSLQKRNLFFAKPWRDSTNNNVQMCKSICRWANSEKWKLKGMWMKIFFEKINLSCCYITSWFLPLVILRLLSELPSIDYTKYITSFTAWITLAGLGRYASINVGAYGSGTSPPITRVIGASK